MRTSKLSNKFLDVMIATEPDLPNAYRSVNKFEGDLQIECSQERLCGILDYLENEKLIKFGDSHRTAFRLLEKGFAYKELRCLMRKEQWKERIFGFVSGIVTAVITGFLLNLI